MARTTRNLRTGGIDIVYDASWNEYDVDPSGNIITIPRSATVQEPEGQVAASQAARQAASQQALVNAQLKSQTIKQQKSLEAQQAKYDEELSRNRQLNTLAEQIANLAGSTTQQTQPVAQQDFSATTQTKQTQFQPIQIPQQMQTAQQALANLSAQRNFGASDLANRLNFQVSDQQILDDYNATKLGRLNNIVSQGNAQIAGIQQRLDSANTLLSQLPSGDPRRTSSQVYVDQLKSDLSSVQSAVTQAGDMIKNYKPLTSADQEGQKEITSFREYLQLPEERATQQLRQIDPESYRTAVKLGQRYRQMATEPLPATTTPQTEQLRSQLEQEAINQLQLGSQLGAEEQRQYQQAARAAQTARGNIFGVAPAVEEAVTTGAAGEQRKLARYGAATQFLASGETTGAALARDIALRDALTQQRLGAASGFIAGGPTLYNLGQARTAQQQQAMQAYVQANQPLPGQFAQAQSTAQPFYQIVQPGTPTDLTQTFANLYGSMANYQAQTYGAYTGAIARQPSGAETFGQVATGLSNLIRI